MEGSDERTRREGILFVPELHQNRAEATTEHLPALDAPSVVATKELPVVTEQVPVVAAPPAGAAAPQAGAQPLRLHAPPVAQPPAPPVAQPPAPPAQPPAKRRSRMRLVGGLLAFVVVGAAAGAGVATALRSDVSTPSSTPSASASVHVITADVTSVDPVGGTGLRHRNGQWQTVTYRTATFGNLQPGVGLLLDLGRSQSVTSVSFEAGPGPITVQLMAGDRPGSTAGAFTPVGSPVTAQGATTLNGTTAGAHRYWLVWVSRLAPSNGGYGAVLSEPVVRGT